MPLRFTKVVGCLLLIVGVMTGLDFPVGPQPVKAAQSLCSATRYALVDVGGYRLNFRYIRGRSPTIVLESGGGADSSQWARLQPELARATGLAVVSYDRAGFGHSDRPPHSYNGLDEVTGLQKGLELLGLGKTVVLVGHSYGGLLNQLYASRYPRSVRGIVLIEPNTVAFVDAIGGPKQLMEIPSPGNPTWSKLPRAGMRQITAFDQTVELVRKAGLTRNIPITVITAGKSWWPRQKESDAYRAGHKAIAAECPNRALVVADKSGHNIPGEQPEIIISAIKTLIHKL